jgi:hypothetical protein
MELRLLELADILALAGDSSRAMEHARPLADRRWSYDPASATLT